MSSDGLFLLLSILVIPFFILAYVRDQRHDELTYVHELTLEYPQLVSKLTLLYSAGMTIYSALDKICNDYEKANSSRHNLLYSNLRYTLNRINQGCSEADEYKLFGVRCKAPCFLRFGNLLQRNLLKGSADLQSILKEEVAKAYDAEKQYVLKKSGEAGTKLLLPMMMIFVVILILIMIPALNSVTLN